MSDYKKSYDQLKASDEAKAKIIDKLATKRSWRSYFKFKYVSLSAIAAVIFCIVTASLLNSRWNPSTHPTSSVRSVNSSSDIKIVNEYTIEFAEEMLNSYNFAAIQNYAVRKNNKDYQTLLIVDKKEQLTVARLTVVGDNNEAENDYYYKDGTYYYVDENFNKIFTRNLPVDQYLEEYTLPRFYNAAGISQAQFQIAGETAEGNILITYKFSNNNSVTYLFDQTNTLLSMRISTDVAEEEYIPNHQVIAIPESVDQWSTGSIFIYSNYYKGYILARGPGKNYQGIFNFPNSFCNIPVVAVDASALRYATNVTKYIVDEENLYFSAVDGVLFNKLQNLLIAYPRPSLAEEYTVPETVLQIEHFAFEGSKNLVVLNLNNAKMINPHTDCIKLKEYKISQTNEFHTVIDGVLFNETGTKLSAYPIGKEAENYIVNNNVTMIGYYAFSGSKISNISFSENLSKIDEYAFYDCPNITSIELPTNMTIVHEYSFARTGLTSIEIPAKVFWLGESAFRDCYYLNQVTFAADSELEVMFDFAFMNCIELEEISLPARVELLGDSLFMNCRKLQKVNIPDDTILSRISYNAFQNCESLAMFSIPKTVTSIDGEAFNGTLMEKNSPSNDFFYVDDWVMGYKGDRSVPLELTIRDGTVGIATYTIRNFDNLITVNLPESLRVISFHAFDGNKQLARLTIPESVIYIGQRAFYNCPELIVTIINSDIIADWDFYWDDGCIIEFIDEEKE